MPKVSVLMPIYKTKEPYLRTAIESILNQTFTDFEFLILDDCPLENRETIVRSYTDPRIKYIKNEKNMGITPSRNKLINMAKGEYLAVMDHDDISLPERFQKQVDFLDTHQTYGVVGVWADSFPKYLDLHHPEKNSDIKISLMRHCTILHPASMIRKSILIDNKIQYEEQYTPCEDYYLWFCLMPYTKFFNIPEVLFRYRFHEENTTSHQLLKMIQISDGIHCMYQKKYPELYRDFLKIKKREWKISIFGKTSLNILKKYKKVSYILINRFYFGNTKQKEEYVL